MSMKQSILLSIIFLQTILFAYSPAPCLKSPSVFFLKGEWIYFAPVSETSYYALELVTGNNPFASGERRSNNFDDFYSGYRISAAYLTKFYNVYLSASWTRLCAEHSDSIDTNSLILPILGAPPFFGNIAPQTAVANAATDDKQFCYHALDITASKPIFFGKCFQVIPSAGIHYGYLEAEENFFYALTIPEDSSYVGELKNRFSGAGPEMGIAFSANIGSRFFLEMGAVGAFLLGMHPSQSLNQLLVSNIPTFSFNIINQKRWRIVPFGKIRASLKYLLDPLFNYCGCPRLGGHLEAGYEALTYFDGLGEITFTDFTQAGFSFDQYRNVTMHGPVVALTLYF
jgi:hypothetical protein